MTRSHDIAEGQPRFIRNALKLHAVVTACSVQTTVLMKKRHRRMLKKTAKSLRKAWKQAAGPVAVTTGALTLGGLTAFAALSPEVRERSRALATSTLQGLRRLTRQSDTAMQRNPLLEHAH